MNISIKYHNSLEIDSDKKALFKEFIMFCFKELSLKKDSEIVFLPKKQDYVKQISTGGYTPSEYKTYVRYEGRGFSDILTTIAHELTHQMQDETGELDKYNDIPDIGGPIEDQANAMAGRLRKMFTRTKPDINIYEI
jgi:hypothetical protein